MTPNEQVKSPAEYAPADFSEIMNLTQEEKKELLHMWKNAHQQIN